MYTVVSPDAARDVIDMDAIKITATMVEINFFIDPPSCFFRLFPALSIEKYTTENEIWHGKMI